MTTIASLAAEVAHWFGDYDQALAFVMTCAHDRGVEVSDQREHAATVELDEDTAREIWEDAALAAESFLGD